MAEYTHKQPIPQCCDVCGFNKIYYGDNELIYGTNRGTWHKCYYCPNCKASVSCHPGTNIPKGLMATAALRRARQRAHLAFDVLWHDGLMDRDSAYLWMGELLGLDYDSAHIGLLTREQLEQVIAAVPGHYRTVVRRKAKQNAKRIERASREQQAANRGRGR